MIRKEFLNGRMNLVAPVVLIVSRVNLGSSGPIYYPASELAKAPSAWDDVPLVVNHPIRNGRPVTARDPEVLRTRAIGVVKNARYENGKLLGEAWFDVEATQRVDYRIFDRLNAGLCIEVSTGLHAQADMTPGIAPNGARYSGIARNYQPDHLAILPDEVGACSVDDGCGIFANRYGLN
jgi:hypothetical protein